MPLTRTLHLVLGAAVLLWACGNPPASARSEHNPGKAKASDGASAQLKRVKPPFPVRGDLEGLLMVWYDARGVHTAQKRSEIPESARNHVRIDSLTAAPDARLDPDHIYVADLRKPGADGNYPVHETTRSWFDAQVDRARPKLADNANASVVIYKASWCGVCRAAASYLRSRHVAFVEKDVEKDPGASEEMMRKARAKGLHPSGVPVIDFHGQILLGFDQARLDSLIDHYAANTI